MGCLCLLQASALDIPKGTFYFDNSITRYSHVKFVYGSNNSNVTYVLSMTDEGNNRWAITIPETVHNMYRYCFAETSLPDGLRAETFPTVKDYISLTLNENRTITSDVAIPVGGIYIPTSNDKWAPGAWQTVRDPNQKPYSGTLPVLFINTEAPINDKDTYVRGTYYIDALGLEGYVSLGSADAPLGLQMKGRGNYTWNDFDKKPYRLKLDEKARPLGMKNNRHFTLLAHADDELGFLRNTVGFELSRLLGLAYTPEQQPVEVVLNGDYIGLYMLTDKIRVGKQRVNIVEQRDLCTDPDSITGGWLLEINNYDESQQVRMTEGNGAMLRVNYHTPEMLSTQQLQYLTDLLKATDRAIYAQDKSSTDWERYIDMDVLARYYIVQEVLDDAESFHGSCYFYKDMGSESKFMFGPVWDFGNSFRRGFDQFIYDNSPFGQNWIGEIARFPRFQQQVKTLWQWFKGSAFDSLDGFIDGFVDHIAIAAESDAQRWPRYSNSGITDRKNDFKRRMNEKVRFLCRKWGEGVVGIETTTAQPDFDERWYTLDGRLLSRRPAKAGVYIRGGRKVVVR